MVVTSFDALIATCLQTAETIQVSYPLTAQTLRQMVAAVQEDERVAQEQESAAKVEQEQLAVDVTLIRAETGGYCLAINNLRVAGPKPALTINNVLRVWKVKRDRILQALDRSNEGDEDAGNSDCNGG
jgi:hypothetical protein